MPAKGLASGVVLSRDLVGADGPRSFALLGALLGDDGSEVGDDVPSFRAGQFLLPCGHEPRSPHMETAAANDQFLVGVGRLAGSQIGGPGIVEFRRPPVAVRTRAVANGAIVLKHNGAAVRRVV